MNAINPSASVVRVRDGKPAWVADCIIDGRNKKPIPNFANVMLALRRDPALGGAAEQFGEPEHQRRP